MTDRELRRLAKYVAMELVTILPDDLRQSKRIGLNEAAAYIGRSPSFLYKQKDKIPRYTIGRNIVYDTQDLDKWMREYRG